MTAIRLIIITIAISFWHIHDCGAAIVYVNINNSHPGNGGSWSTAYTDLNAAMAAATWGDTVWVAQGTYRPTATTDRNISFMIKDGIALFGGFAGAETKLRQRDWAAHPTILSGDIGRAGDSTDNSYHVVRFYDTRATNTQMDGFTIRDGNGDKNWPAITTPWPGNQAGGLLIEADRGLPAYATIVHCIFTANTGRYGGACSGYATGANSKTSIALLDCMFLDNTGGLGAGFCSIALEGAGIYGVNALLNCIFSDNKSFTAEGSAIGALADGAGSQLETLVRYCTMYNNTPAVTCNRVRNKGTSRMDYANSIIWIPGGLYREPIDKGTGITYISCDLAMADPGCGNINSDPQLVNPAGNDFHVAPCSPVIDAGGQPYTGWLYDYTGARRLEGPAADIGVYESTKKVSPPATASPVGYYQHSTAAPLTATGTDLRWYATCMGGTGTPTAPVPSTAAVGVTIYYVTQTVPGACESVRQPVAVAVSRSAPFHSSPR